MALPVFLETSSVANILKDDASFPYWVIKLIANIDTHVVKDKPKPSVSTTPSTKHGEPKP